MKPYKRQDPHVCGYESLLESLQGRGPQIGMLCYITLMPEEKILLNYVLNA